MSHVLLTMCQRHSIHWWLCINYAFRHLTQICLFWYWQCEVFRKSRTVQNTLYWTANVMEINLYWQHWNSALMVNMCIQSNQTRLRYVDAQHQRLFLGIVLDPWLGIWPRNRYKCASRGMARLTVCCTACMDVLQGLFCFPDSDMSVLHTFPMTGAAESALCNSVVL